MFRASVFLSLFALALAATPKDLKVSVKPFSTSVSSIEDIGFSVVVSNPTDSDIRVISKNNVLDSSITRSFAVSKDDKDVLFTGARVAYDFTHDSNYITIPASNSVAINHTNIAPLFDFSTHGTGTYTFAPSAIFQTAPNEAPVTASVDPIQITVTKDVGHRELISKQKREAQSSNPSCNDSGRLQTIVNSIADARALAGATRDNVNDGAYGDFFGNNDKNTVAYRYDLIAGDSTSRTVYCNQDPSNICTGGVVAYTLLYTSGGQITSSDIYNCDLFFTGIQDTPNVCSQAVGDVNNSKGGVELHELSHATSGTADIAYGCQAVKGLSDADKLNNADNYQCFALYIYRTQRC